MQMQKYKEFTNSGLDQVVEVVKSSSGQPSQPEAQETQF
jgi:hypothetical protein